MLYFKKEGQGIWRHLQEMKMHLESPVKSQF